MTDVILALNAGSSSLKFSLFATTRSRDALSLGDPHPSVVGCLLIQLDTVARETPKVRLRPRKLLRSCACVQNLLAASFRRDIGGRVLAAAMPTGRTAIRLFPLRGMPITLLSLHFHSGGSEGPSSPWKAPLHSSISGLHRTITDGRGMVAWRSERHCPGPRYIGLAGQGRNRQTLKQLRSAAQQLSIAALLQACSSLA
jgi:hypothetical protein